MTTEPMPHEKLTDEEIKESILVIQGIYLFLKRALECAEIDSPALSKKMKEFDDNVIKLKKHFLPEKFSTIKITLDELSSMYGER